ncbi:MAG: ribonucleotide reductase N-terminal alpha domain-containing protein, partial [Blastocatellia bacterium]
MDLTDNALIVLEKRILARDNHGRVVETPDQMLHRVARCVAAADIEYGTPAEVDATEAAFLDIMS